MPARQGRTNFIRGMQNYLSMGALVVPKNSANPNIDIITLDSMNITADAARITRVSAATA